MDRVTVPDPAAAKMIDALLLCPYVPGGSDLHGADCWGIVELWYGHVLGIALNDRAGLPPGHEGLQAGFNVALCDDGIWQPAETAEDHCLIIMRAGQLLAGHVGVFFDGRVLHSSDHQGCTYQPISDRWIRSKITGFLKLK